jgi:hypothetical protein
MICGAGCGIRPRLPQFLLRPDGAALRNPAQSIWTIKQYMMDRVNHMSETQGVCEIDREATFQIGRNCSTVVFDKRFFSMDLSLFAAAAITCTATKTFE